MYIRTAQSELINSDFVPIRIYIFGSELVNLDLAVRVDQIGSDLIESDIWCILTDIYSIQTEVHQKGAPPPNRVEQVDV
jgi:hypothetical protein